MTVTSLHDSLDFLSKQRDAEAARQRHAEVMAWAGVAVYVGAMAAVVTTLPHPDSTPWVFRTGVEVGLVLTFLIALGYTRRQFNVSDWACRVAAGYERALTSMLENGDAPPAEPTAVAPSGRSGAPGRRAVAIVFPPRIATEDAAWETHPGIVRRLVPDTCPGGRSTELLAYALVAIAFVVASVVALTLAPARSSAITSPGATTFRVGSFSSFTVTASGSPTPRLSEFGALPVGVVFTDDGNGTATLSGSPGPGSAGRYEIQIRAANGIAPDAMRNVVVRVTGARAAPPTRAEGGTAPGAFTSAPTATAWRGAPFTFAIAASGSPPPRLKLVGRLPRGVVFHDNGNGTATLSGTPHNHHPVVDHLRLKAVFGRGAARQVAVQFFTLTVG